MTRLPRPAPAEFWHAPALPLSEDELTVLTELQRLGGFTSFANVQRAALHHLTQHFEIRVESDIWRQR